MACKRIKGIAHTDTMNPGMESFSRIRCKQWTCGYCAGVNRSQWRAVLIKYLREDLREWSFLTITVPQYIHNSRGNEDQKTKLSALFINKYWNSLLTAMKRKYGKFDFVRVIERHKTGVLHLHILLSARSDAILKYRNEEDKEGYWYSETMHRILCPTREDQDKKRKNRKTWGYIHDWRNIDTKHKSIMYVTKYMTKRDQIFEEIAKERRLRVIQTSRAIKFQPEKSPHEWTMKSAIYEDDLTEKTWLDMNQNREITREDLKPYYPLPEEYGDS
jgi:hypothetical protein